MSAPTVVSSTLADSTNSLSSSTLLVSPRLNANATSDASAKRMASQISRAYKQASQFFLQRRFPESLFTIQPLITRRAPDGGARSEDGSGDVGQQPPPLIASASRAARVKVWSLYVTLLNSIVELGPDDGKNQFGNAQWRVMERKVRDGTVWEDVVQNGYGGIEGAVDPDVVSNLATLLLAQSSSQTLNQQRLEAYLAASGQPNLDVSAHFDANGETKKGGVAHFSRSGTDTPRDLNSRIKILELYALHVLPRNDEWAYAKEFVAASDVLDEDTREEFLQTLTALEDERRNEQDEARRDAELRERAEAEEHRRRDAERRKLEEAALEKSSQGSGRSRRGSSGVGGGGGGGAGGVDTDHAGANGDAVRSPSERDYGIDDEGPYRPSTRKVPSKSSLKESRAAAAAQPNGTRLSGHPRRGKRGLPPPRPRPHGMLGVVAEVQAAALRIVRSVQSSPGLVLRVVLVALALLLALARNDVRVRLARILGVSWDRVKRTIGMGVKVSYV